MEGCLGEESFQMWELNRRLEAYLARVKALEEQNELLSAELGVLRAQSGDTSWRARADNELAALRALVDQSWREKHAAEVARDNLAEELEGVAGRCQQQRLARERAAEEVARSRRAVEAEKCSQAWLSTQVADLERELEALRAAHEEERANLNAQAACTPRGPPPPRGPPAPAPEVEELAQRLGEAWRGAVRGYQERVAHMETSLGQARERLGRAVQGAREGRLELQQLQVERGGLQERRAALEQRLEGRWQERLRATEKFQLAVEALEQEKQGLQSQIAQILEGRQQLAHLKMSLSLEVATYRTLLEAENSRLQTPGSGSKASLSFQDPKLELHFSGTSEGRRLAPLLPTLSPTPLTSPLPDTLGTPVPAFLKSQEFLQARTPTLASTPIPPTSQTPHPATDTEIRAQKAPLSLLQPQGGKQQAPEPLQGEAIPASILPGPEEPGGKQQEASIGQSSEDHVSLAPPLSPDYPSLEAKDGEPSGSGVSSISQEEGEGQIWGFTEEKAEVKVVNSLQQETWQEEGDLERVEVQDSQCPLEKETLKSPEKEIQEPLMSLDKQTHETLRSLEKENQESLRSLEEDNLETLKTLEKENQELLTSLEEKDLEVVRLLENETLELFKSKGKEEPDMWQSLDKENQEVMKSLEGNLETFLFPGRENQELVKPLEEENLEALGAPEKKNQEPLISQEAEKQETLRPVPKENQELLRSLKDENQETLRSLESGEQESLRSQEQENQETLKPLEKETLESLRSLGEEDQKTLSSLEKVNLEPLKSLGKDREIFSPPEKENPELLRSLKEGSVEAMQSLETGDREPLKSAGEEGLEILKSPETQESLWPLTEKNQGTMKCLEKGFQEPLGSMEENQETLRPLEKENQETRRSLGEGDVENLRSPEEVDKESQRYLGEERNMEKEENQESLRSLREEGQELPLSANQQRWEDVVRGDQELGQEIPPGRSGVENEDEAELGLRGHDGFAGKEEAVELGLNAAGEAWSTEEGHPGRLEPEEQMVPAEGAVGEGDTEGLQDPEGQPEQVGAPDLGAPQGMAAEIGPMLEDDAAPGGDRASPQVTLGSETAMGESDAGAMEGWEQEAVGREDPGHLATEEVTEPPLGEEDLEARRVQGLEGPRKDLEETDTLESELSKLPRKNRDPPEPEGLEGWEKSEHEAPWGDEEADPAETLCHEGSSAPPPRPLGTEKAEEEAESVLGSPSPRPTETCLPTSLPKDAPGPQPQAEGNQGASWGLEGRAEALGKPEGEQEELGSGGIPEGFQDEEKESGEESEADVLGETLPDSTPLGLYPRSPSSPRWGLDGEERLSPQGEDPKEGWDPTALAPEGPGTQSSEEEEGDGEGRQPDSDLSEEFEDLGTEVSLLPGVSGEVAEPLGQVPQLLLEPAAWDRDGESDGFADEEESGEEGEEDDDDEEGRGLGPGRWDPGSSEGSLQALGGPQRENLLEPETVSFGVPWDDSLRDAAADAPVTVQEPESQDSAETSGSEEGSDPVPLEGEDRVPGALETPGGVADAGQGTGDTLGVNGGGPSLEEESEPVNRGVMNGLEQSEGVGQGKLGAPEGDQGSPLEGEEGKGLKTPWEGVPLNLGPGQFLKFTQREGDGDSWSSGED
ncbi:nestin [Choloepus didactylus]|uniref:nestin n=1 Tax=Choloepus didactylus TaxID=27675 RepID=UPI0018A00185|nr:nestin [Choloepus didactylus]